MAGFRKILVPIDFSTHSARALQTGIELAKQFGAKLHLLHCYQINVGAISPYGLVIPESFDRDIREAATRQLAQWREKATSQGVQAEAEVSPIFPSEAIASTAERIGADLIVRVIFTPIEVPAGTVTAIIGAPYFLYLLMGKQRHDG